MINEATTHGLSLAATAELRQRARDVIDEAIATPDYQVNHETVRRILNMAFATEFESVLSDKRGYPVPTSLGAWPSLGALLEGASREPLADGGPPSTRIPHRRGTPSRRPNGTLEQSCTEYF